MDDLYADALRELEKDLILLDDVQRMLNAEAAMNAAKHMTSKVLPNPLAAAVSARVASLNEAIVRLRMRQPQLPVG